MLRKILFIIPPYFNIDDFLDPQNSSSIPAFTIPYGVLSLESYVKANSRNEVKIELLDLNYEVYKIIPNIMENESIKEKLLDLVSEKLQESFDIVAISALFNSSYLYLGDIINAVKNVENSPLCIIGGGLATNLCEALLEDFPLLDGVCYAEGEIPLLHLVDSDNFYSLLNEHPSWMTKATLKEGKTPKTSYIENLDEIPMFDYKLINLDHYNARSLDKQYCSQENKRELSIHTSRGCPFNCVFCANSSVHGKKVRYMSDDRVISEIDHMINNHGMNVLLIEDDHFLSKKKRATKILTELIKRKIRIEFPNGIAVYAIDEEIGKLLKEAGVTTVQLAVESCSDYVLKEVINKPHKVAQVRRAAKILQKNGILVHAYIVLGLPGEMEEHRKESLETIKEIGFDWVYFFIAAPIVGSRLFKMCVENDYLVEKDFKNHIVSKGSIKAPGVDPVEIEKTAYLMNLDVNFVNNANVAECRYDRALSYFTHIANKYPNHAIVHYVLANVYKRREEEDLAGKHHDNYMQIINENKEWKAFADGFGLS